jgi:hypothetical protein
MIFRVAAAALIPGTGSLLVVQTAQAAAPDYVPTGSDIFEGYEALAEPRADVPVGALWVQDFGPHGEGAAPDNLLNVRSLSGITMNRDMQIRLTLGLLKFLNVDPGIRSHMAARFTDITIVRVKDITKLAGPTGEPRIYEALRAATITVTVDSDIGLDIGNSLGSKIPVLGRGQSGRKRSLTLDGRDLFIAYRVVTPKVVTGKIVGNTIELKGGLGVAELGDYRVGIDASGANLCHCVTAAERSCGEAGALKLVVSKSDQALRAQDQTEATGLIGESLSIPLPVPVSDGAGGLFTKIAAKLTPRRSRDRSDCLDGTPGKARLELNLVGERLETLEEPKAKGW